jgi:hypothetical protein
MKTPEPFIFDPTTDIQLTEYPQSYWDFATPNQRVLLAQMEMWKKKYVESQKHVKKLERFVGNRWSEKIRSRLDLS